LDEHRILGSAIEGLDLQILLDPFIELVAWPTETKSQVPETFASAPLTEKHSRQMRPVGEFSGLGSLPGMAVNYAVENLSRDEL
jgi:hypothetical protein